MSVKSNNQIQLSKEQLPATYPQSSVWVSANAGSGKTSVLTMRILSLLIAGNKPEKILCITYTNAAALNMQTRIIGSATKLILASDDELKQELENLGIKTNVVLNNVRKNLEYIIDHPSKLKIQTIHSFCQYILKSFPLEAGVAPYFDIIDDIKKKEMLEKVWQDVIINSDIIKQLLSEFSEYTIKNILKELTENSTSVERFLDNEYSEKLKSLLNPQNNTIKELQESFLKYVKPNLITVSELLKVNKIKAKSLAESIERFLSSPDFFGFEKIYLTEDRETKELRLSGSKVSNNIKKIDEVLIILNEGLSKYLEVLEQVKNINILNSTTSFLKLFSYYLREYQSRKERSALLDFNDIITKAKKLLNDSENKEWVLFKLDGGIDHLLLDEAQDTSPTQWGIVEAVVSEFFSGDTSRNKKRTFFVVGDEKQSIYSFQGANIENYLKIKNKYKANLNKINLEESFRSAPAILQFADKIYKNAELKNKITDEEQVNHIAHNNEEFGYVEVKKLLPYEKYQNKNGVHSWHLKQEYEHEEEERNRILLAEKIVQDIFKLKQRGIEEKDILVLVKKRDVLSRAIEEKLKQKGVASSSVNSEILNDSLLVKDLVAILKFCLNNDDDLNLAELLKSPVFSVDESDLFRFSDKRSGSLYTSLKQSSFYKINILDQIKRSYQNSASIYEFYTEILHNKYLIKHFIGYFGSDIEEEIYQFLNFIEQFENDEKFSAEKLVIYFANNEIRSESEKEDGENLRILTHHGAKGLEAKIVIIANAADYEQKSKQYIIDDELILISGSAENKNKIFKELQDRKNNIEYNEYFRLLYVALTRSAKELYIYGVGNKTTKNDTKSWYNFIYDSAKTFAKEDENGNLIFSDDKYMGLMKTAHEAQSEERQEIKLPTYLEQKLNVEETEIITPSKFLESKNFVINKNIDLTFGIATHKVLEYILTMHEQKRDDATEILLKKYNLDEGVKQEIISEIKLLLSNKGYIGLMSGVSRSEVPVAGYVDGKFITGKIDLIIFKTDEIIIADYKTNRDAKENKNILVEKYTNQMELYKKLLKLMYPDKNIKTCLIFTKTTEIVFL